MRPVPILPSSHNHVRLARYNHFSIIRHWRHYIGLRTVCVLHTYLAEPSKARVGLHASKKGGSVSPRHDACACRPNTRLQGTSRTLRVSKCSEINACVSSYTCIELPVSSCCSYRPLGVGKLLSRDCRPPVPLSNYLLWVQSWVGSGLNEWLQ